MRMNKMRQVFQSLMLKRVLKVIGSRPSAFGLRYSLCWLLTLAFIWNAAVTPATTTAESVGRPVESRPTSKAAPAVQTGGTITVFGPTRITQQPFVTTYVAQFARPEAAVPNYSLTMSNGSIGGTNKVTSVRVRINGNDLFIPSFYNFAVSPITRPVSLSANNTIEVSLIGPTLSYVTITITAVGATLDPPTPARGNQGQTLSVTLTGHDTHWVVGQTRASFGGEVSVGGESYGDFGPVQVTSPTTAVAQVMASPTAALSPRTVTVTTPRSNSDGNETVTATDSFVVAAVTPPGPAASTVTTLAGTPGSAGWTDGPGTLARFYDLAGIAVGPGDIVYVADSGNQRIRRVATDGTVTTVAGNGLAGFNDGPGDSAQFNYPQGVAVDATGVVYVADTNNHRIRRVATDGTVSTIAGDGTAGLVNGTGTGARFNAPRGIAVNSSGSIYVADTGNSAVRVISPAGVVSTAAGDGTVGSNDSPNAHFNGLAGVAVDGASVYVYLADTGNHQIRRLDSSNTVFTIAGADRGFVDGGAGAARFANPAGIAVDGAGHIVVADTTNSLVREIDPVLAVNGDPTAVTTLAGTGDRGLVNGAGNVTRFSLPKGVAVASSSAIIIADTGNQVLRQILIPPVITSLSPSQGLAGQSVMIYGDHFDGRGPSSNTVRFTRSGGGTTVATVTAATRSQLTVTVPADAATGPVTVQTQGGTATSPTNFVVSSPAPVITDFNPKSGHVGDSVTLTGTSLKDATTNPVVTFTGTGGARLTAAVTSATTTQVVVTVPNGAVTGPIDSTTSGGKATTSSSYFVQTQQDYTLTLAPSTATAVQGSTATYVVSVTSPQATFTQLVSLSATGLPAGATATFNPPQITAGASSTLSLSLSGTLAAGSYSFTVSGTAKVDGSDLVRMAGATLSVTAGGQTTLAGRVLSTSNEPIIGATVSLDGRTATTDAAGAFLLSGVTAGSNRPVMIDGRTASAPNRTYPVITEPATVVAGQANVVPFTFYLPPIDTQYEVTLVPTQTTTVTNPRVANLQMTVPAGANLRNRDGSPVTRVSITPLAIDRTPTPLPSNAGAAMVYTSQPGGACVMNAQNQCISTGPKMPVIYPNLTGADPNTRMELYAFDHDTVQWYIYGYGRVSADGRTIVPEIDPTTNQPYGLRDFSWHFPSANPDGNPAPPGCGNPTDKPVDLARGIKIETVTDIAFRGARGGLELTRIYTSALGLRNIIGRFGRGTKDSYDIKLTGSFQERGTGRVLFPEQGTGRLFSYAGTDSSGALVFTTTATSQQLGDQVRRINSATLEYRTANGEVMRFDGNGRLVAKIDRNGNTTTLSYTGSNLTSITDAVGRAISLNYDAQGRVTQAKDPLGRLTQYTYDASGMLAAVTDPLGNVTRYGYDTNGQLITVTDPRGNVAKRITYDSAGKVTDQQFADNGVTHYSYTLSGQFITAVTITDSLGRVQTKRFNAAGYVIEESDALGQKSSIDRAIGTNLPTSTTGPCGCPEATRQFDERGNITALTDRSGQTTRMEFEPVFNQVTKLTDPLGRMTTFGYDALGNLTSITNALNQTTTFSYDGFGQLTSTTDALGHTRRLEYDTQGNVTAQVDALNNRVTLEYDGMGRLTAVVDPLGRRMSQSYDELGRLTTVTDPAGAITTFTYDANSNRTGVKDPLGNQWAYAYDAKNRLTSQTDPIKRVVRIAYDTEDEIFQITSPSGRTALYTYDQRGQQATMSDPLGGIIRYTYDNRGNLTTLSDQRGNTTTFTYDALFRLAGWRDPLGRFTAYEYDAVDNLTVVTDRLGRRVTANYDELNRPQSVSYPDAILTSTYDPAGRRTRVDDTQSGSITWGYDNANRLLTETTSAGTITYGYNAASQRTSMTAADRTPVTYGYDTAGRLQTITQGSEVFTYGYDTLSRRASLQRPNGVTTAYTYDEVSRLTRLTHTKGAALEDFQYTYTADDEIATITSLASAPLVPQTKTVSSADADNHIAQFGAASFAFDNKGQTSTKTDGTGATGYQWDARGRLTQVTLPNSQTVSYSYDPLGRRKSRTVGGVTTTFLYDGAEVVLDRVGASTTVDYLNGAGVDEKLRQISTGSSNLYFLHDHLSSTAALTDSLGGVVERQQYEAFGASVGSTLTRYGYTGRELDATTGLLYYRARWYDPQQGRFITEDPIGFRGGLNLYAYADNNPVIQIDPTGLDKLKLPADPSQLPPEWKLDPTHRNPYGERYRHPNGDILDFHKGRSRPGGKKKTWRENDHWHYNCEKKHYEPGEEIEVPDSEPAPEEPPKRVGAPEFDPFYPGPVWDNGRPVNPREADELGIPVMPLNPHLGPMGVRPTGPRPVGVRLSFPEPAILY